MRVIMRLPTGEDREELLGYLSLSLPALQRHIATLQRLPKLLRKLKTARITAAHSENYELVVFRDLILGADAGLPEELFDDESCVALGNRRFDPRPGEVCALDSSFCEYGIPGTRRFMEGHIHWIVRVRGYDYRTYSERFTLSDLLAASENLITELGETGHG